MLRLTMLRPMKFRLIFSLAAALLVQFGAFSTAQAQVYPSRPVRIVVPAPAGGGLDVLIRAYSRELSLRWGQPVVVENRGGASGIVGANEVVARGDRDGYTLLAVTDNYVIHNRYAFKSMPFDPDKDLVGVALLAQADQLLIAATELPVKDIRELVAHARKDGVKLSYGSWGEASQPHLVYETLNSVAGTQIVHVPYKGVAPVLVAIGGNEVQLSVASSGTANTLLKSGKAKVLAAASRERVADFPALATTAEQGFPDLQAGIWFGVMAPSGISEAVTTKIADDTRAILANAAFAEQHIVGKGWRVLPGGSKEFAALVKQQTPVIEKMIRAAKIQPQ